MGAACSLGSGHHMPVEHHDVDAMPLPSTPALRISIAHVSPPELGKNVSYLTPPVIPDSPDVVSQYSPDLVSSKHSVASHCPFKRISIKSHSPSNFERKQLPFEHYMPTYTFSAEIDVTLSYDDEKTLSNLWDKIISGNTDAIKIMITDEKSSAATIFFTKFYDLFFRLAPNAKPMFKSGVIGQSRMMAGIIKFIIKSSTAKDDLVFEESMKEMAAKHNERGVNIDMYSPMGLALLTTIRECSGELYTTEIDVLWRKAFTKMFRIIIPNVINGIVMTNILNTGLSVYSLFSADDAY